MAVVVGQHAGASTSSSTQSALFLLRSVSFGQGTRLSSSRRPQTIAVRILRVSQRIRHRPALFRRRQRPAAAQQSRGCGSRPGSGTICQPARRRSSRSSPMIRRAKLMGSGLAPNRAYAWRPALRTFANLRRHLTFAGIVLAGQRRHEHRSPLQARPKFDGVIQARLVGVVGRQIAERRVRQRPRLRPPHHDTRPAVDASKPRVCPPAWPGNKKR